MASPAHPTVESSKEFLVPRFTEIPEATLTTTRPLGNWEANHVLGRLSRGLNDFYFLVSLDSSPIYGQRINEEDVVLAYTLIRLHHPILASCVSLTGPHPTFVCNSPMTEAHAIQEAQAAISFGTFDNRDKALSSWQSRYLSTDPHYALDVRHATFGLGWLRGTGAARGQYILGTQNVHLAADGRHIMNAIREFLQLLCEPERAKAELTDHFSRPLAPLRIPESVDNLIASLPSQAAAETELVKSDRMYLDIMEDASQEKSGIRAGGTPAVDKVVVDTILHHWSPSQASTIRESCRGYGVTITHLSTAALALASVQSADGDSKGEDASSSASQKHSHSFTINTVLDLSHRLQHSAVNVKGSDTAMRAATIPVSLRLAHVPKGVEGERRALWEMAQQCKARLAAFLDSPFFWQLFAHSRPLVVKSYFDYMGGKPALPIMSSMGDCTQFLPTRYRVTASVGQGHREEKEARELCITNMSTTGKSAYPAVHLYTYDSSMYLQVTYNSTFLSPTVMRPYFQRVFDMITRVGIDWEQGQGQGPGLRPHRMLQAGGRGIRGMHTSAVRTLAPATLVRLRSFLRCAM